MRTAAVAVLAFLMLLPALPAQAQVGYHAGVAMDLWGIIRTRGRLTAEWAIHAT